MALYTVDASVFLNAFNPFEAGHSESHAFMERLARDRVPIAVPTLLLPEAAGAIARGRGDPILASEFVTNLAKLQHLILVPLDLSLAEQAADVASAHSLRGGDAVYASVALRFSATLVTLDREQRDRLANVVQTRYPHEALADLDL